MEEFVYILCSVTAASCSLLLLRGFFRRPIRLLLWCGLAFAALALENAILFVDLVLLPHTTDLSPLRNSIALIGMALLLYGLTLETK